MGDEGIAIQREVGFRRREDRACFLLRSIHHVSSGGTHHRMHLPVHVTIGRHLFPQLGDGPFGIGQHPIDSG